MKEKKQFYREFLPVLSALVVPIVLQNLISYAVNALDVLMLGFVGQNELSAVSLAGQISFIYSLFMSGITSGVVILSSQYWGKKDTETIGRVYGIALRFSAVMSVLFWAVSLFLPKYLMLIFTNDAEMIRIGSRYLQIMSFGFLCMGVSQVYMATVRSVERVSVCTLIGSVTLVLNAILNAVLIFGWFGAPKLGVVGVAVATVIARCVEVIWCMIDAHRDKKVILRVTAMLRRDSMLAKDFVKYTLPALTNFLVWGGAFSMYSAILGHLGSDVVAANSVISVVRNLAVVLGCGIGAAGSILIGKELGSNQLERAKKEASALCHLALIAGAAGGLLMILFRPLIMNWAGLSEQAQSYLGIMIWINSYYCIGKAINSTVVGGIFCAGGDTRFGLICDAIDMWGFSIPLSILLAFVFKVPPMWVCFAMCLDEFVKMPFVWKHYHKYNWLKNITREEAA